MELSVLMLLVLEAALGLWLLYREGLLKTSAAAVVAALLLTLAFALRGAAFDYETLDYQNFLARWAAFYREHGGFLALDTSVGNYNIPYLYFLALFSYFSIRDLYLIKLLSCLFDLLLAWAAMRLCRRFTQSAPRLLACFFVVLFLPSVFLNSALWGQCDSIYAALAILGICLALEDKPVASMVLIALSFGVKLQAVFVMPIYAVLWMYKKFEWKHFLLFPLTYLVLVMPAVLLGRPFLDTITLYFNQTGSIGGGLNYNSPSIFAIFWRIPEAQRSAAASISIGAAAVYMLNLLAMAFTNRKKLSDQSILGMALLFAIGIPFLLPHMHERYFYLVDILTVVLAFALPRYAPSALLAQFASLLGYHAYLKMRYLLPMRYGSAALILAVAMALICFLSGLHEPEARKPEARKGKKKKIHS